MGITPKGQYVTAANAKADDAIILTKSAGVEGTAILASDRATELKNVLNTEQLQTAREFYRKISVVKDALTAYTTGGVHAMHDPTEGGVAGGIHEMADSANLSFELHQEKIRVEPETAAICRHFDIDPLRLIGSGALLISAQPDKANEIIAKLQSQNIPATVIGKFVSNLTKRTLIQPNRQATILQRPTSDHLWLALRK
jgi:hydrogenase maturation factor